jgi:phosphatidylserine decarboxylase
MRIPIASDGYRFIIPLVIITVALALSPMIWLAGVTGLLLLFVLNFFRDPERTIPNEAGVIISPGDGKVVEIIEEKDTLLDEPYRRISIFLNVFNVHVQRTPVAGRIERVQYNKGKFLNAASHKASLDNEQNSMIIHTGKEKVLVKQIAGLIARRIVCWAKEGDNYSLGQRFGLIRFGSRVDLFLPLSAEVKVSLGDHVAGGSSIIGYLK